MNFTLYGERYVAFSGMYYKTTPNRMNMSRYYIVFEKLHHTVCSVAPITLWYIVWGYFCREKWCMWGIMI